MNPSDDVGQGRSGVSRRSLLGGGAAAAVAIPLLSGGAQAAPVASAGGVELVTVTAEVNGRPVSVRVDPRLTLLDTMREERGLIGAKKGCDRGQCGACTVHVDGRRVLAFLAGGTTLVDLIKLDVMAPAQVVGPRLPRRHRRTNEKGGSRT